MDPLWEALFKGIGAAGFPSVLMAVAVWYLQKTNRELIMQLNNERQERLATLEAHVETCDKERSELRSKFLDFALRLGHVEDHQA